MKAANILVSTAFPPNVGVESGLQWGQGEGSLQSQEEAILGNSTPTRADTTGGQAVVTLERV